VNHGADAKRSAASEPNALASRNGATRFTFQRPPIVIWRKYAPGSKQAHSRVVNQNIRFPQESYTLRTNPPQTIRRRRAAPAAIDICCSTVYR
jgi:hypothetical protein